LIIFALHLYLFLSVSFLIFLIGEYIIKLSVYRSFSSFAFAVTMVQNKNDAGFVWLDFDDHLLHRIPASFFRFEIKK